jgi:hypothetical protein
MSPAASGEQGRYDLGIYNKKETNLNKTSIILPVKSDKYFALHLGSPFQPKFPEFQSVLLSARTPFLKQVMSLK